MSQIREALAGKTLLLTGVTGFFAKALLVKILGEVPEVRRVYVLIRPGASARDPLASVQTRLRREILDSNAFATLRQRHREAFAERIASRIVPVPGDLSQDRLGCDGATFERLAAEVELILNSAASVSFDESLAEALELNALGPSRLLALARAAGDIPMVQVSTAYVCGESRGTIPEEPSAVGLTPAARRSGGRPLDLDAFLETLREACREVSGEGNPEAVHRALVAEGLARARAHGWHDVYTMTKSLGEQVLVRDRGRVPLAIVRPSIIESALQEPQPGWLDGLRMADPLIVAFGRGQLRDFPGDPARGIDVVPVDLVVNGTLAAAARLAREGGLTVFHAATGDVAPITVGEFSHNIYEYFLHHPFRDRTGRPIHVRPWRFPSPAGFDRRYRGLRLRPLRVLREALAHPALAPLRGVLEGAASTRIASLEQLVYLADLYGPYTRLACTFDTGRLRALVASLDAEDRARFPCDAREIDWREYVQDIHIPGLKHFVLRMPEVPGAARSKALGLRFTAGRAPAAAEAVPRVGTGSQPVPRVGTGREDAGDTDDVHTLRDLLRRAAARFGPAPALEIRQGERYVQYTFDEVARLAALVGERLLARGVSAGDRVGLLAENRPEWGIAYLGAACQGIVLVPLDPKLPETEVETLLRRTGARALLTSASFVNELSDEALHRLADPLDGIALLDVARFGEPLLGLESPPGPRGMARVPQPDDLASILFTSGTTVAPKGVMLTHANFVANVRAVDESLVATPEDRLLSVLPLHHAFEFTGGFLGPLWVGARITYLPGVNSAQILAAMQERGITMLLGVPRLYQLMAQGIEERLAAAGPGARRALRALGRLSARSGMRGRRALHWHVHRAFGGRVRLLVSGGAPLDPELFDRFRAMGFVLCEGYGLTETAPVLTVNPPGRPRRGSVGLPLSDVELAIAAPDADGVGEIVVRGPNVMRGYLGEPELTAAVLRDGWLHTGDLGRRDADGYVYITGRLKDVIITPAGKTVHPEDVEGLYRDLPGVREVCVLGVAAPGGGEEVHLVVVPDGRVALAPAEILRAIDARSTQAPSHRRVQRVHFHPEELPKTTTLKVKRSELRRRLEAATRKGQGVAADGPEGRRATGPAEQAALALIARLAGMPVERISLKAHLERDLGFDSLMRVEVLAFLDAQRNRPLSEDRVAALATVEDVLGLVRREGGRGAPRAGAAGAAWRQMLERPAGGPRAAAPLAPPGMFPLTLEAARRLLGRYCSIASAGLEHLPARGKGPFLLAANHASHLDAFAVLVALGERAGEISLVGARDYFFDRAWKRTVLPRALAIIPFDREGDFLEGLRLCREAIAQGRSLLIFPEGTRSLTGRLQPFKAGLGVLGVELGIPIVPTAIEGTYDALPKGRALPRRHPVRVTFGPPVLPAPPEGGDEGQTPYERYREAVERVRSAIADLLGPGSGVSGPGSQSAEAESRVPSPESRARDA